AGIHRLLLDQAGRAQLHVHRAVEHRSGVLLDDGVADQPEGGGAHGPAHSPMLSSAPRSRAARKWPANSSAAATIHAAFSAKAAARWSQRIVPVSIAARIPSSTCADGSASAIGCTQTGSTEMG